MTGAVLAPGPEAQPSDGSIHAVDATDKQASGAAPGKERHDKNPYIQGGRGLFALFVFIYHVHHSGLATFWPLDTPVANFALGCMEHGVELFFGISGIVILGSLLRKRHAGVFMWDRISRIGPVLWASTILTLAVILATKMPVPSAYTIVGSFLVLPPFFGIDPVNPIAWTLAFEMMLYWYCAVVWCIRLKPVLVAVAVLAAAVALVYYPRTMMMLAGAVVFYRFQKPSPVDRLARFSLFFLVAYLIALRGLVVWVGGEAGALQPLNFPLVKGVLLELGIIGATILGGIALIGIAKGYGVLGRLLGSRLFVWLGTMSYSFYLWHIPILAAVKRLLKAAHLGDGWYGQPLLFAISLPIALLVAAVSYEVLETRVSRWLRNRYRLPSRPVPASAELQA